MAICNFHQSIHFRRIAIRVQCDYRLCVWRDFSLKQIEIYIVEIRFNI